MKLRSALVEKGIAVGGEVNPVLCISVVINYFTGKHLILKFSFKKSNFVISEK